MRSRWKLFLLLLAALLFCSCGRYAIPSDTAYLRKPVFVIDPGHGGEDGGAVSADGLKESEINLAVCRRLSGLLGLLGYETVMTRDSEELAYPPDAGTVRHRKQADMDRRIALVNGTPGAVLVSVHQNKYPDAAPEGAQVYYQNGELSKGFAEYVSGVLKTGLGDTVRPAARIPDNIYLMRKIECPGILIECGFLSNPRELGLLRSESYQTKLALCISCACAGYADVLEGEYGKG